MYHGSNALGLNVSSSSKARIWYSTSLRYAQRLFAISLRNSGVSPFFISPRNANLSFSAVGAAVQGCLPGGYWFGSSGGSFAVLVGVGSEVLLGKRLLVGSTADFDRGVEVDKEVDVVNENEDDSADEVGKKDEVGRAVEFDQDVVEGRAVEFDQEVEVGRAVEFDQDVVVGNADEVVFLSPSSTSPVR